MFMLKKHNSILRILVKKEKYKEKHHPNSYTENATWNSHFLSSNSRTSILASRVTLNSVPVSAPPAPGAKRQRLSGLGNSRPTGPTRSPHLPRPAGTCGSRGLRVGWGPGDR